MAVTLKYLSAATRYCELFIDSEDDLLDCPSLTGAGNGAMSTVNGISQGSKAILTTTDDTYYRLKGDNSWVKITSSGGGGGGGTGDYNQLANRPSVNGRILEGNVTSDDIDVANEPIVTGETLII